MNKKYMLISEGELQIILKEIKKIKKINKNAILCRIPISDFKSQNPNCIMPEIFKIEVF